MDVSGGNLVSSTSGAIVSTANSEYYVDASGSLRQRTPTPTATAVPVSSTRKLLSEDDAFEEAARILQTIDSFANATDAPPPPPGGLVRVASTEVLSKFKGMSSALPDTFFETLRSISFTPSATTTTTFAITGFMRNNVGQVRAVLLLPFLSQPSLQTISFLPPSHTGDPRKQLKRGSVLHSGDYHYHACAGSECPVS